MVIFHEETFVGLALTLYRYFLVVLVAVLISDLNIREVDQGHILSTFLSTMLLWEKWSSGPNVDSFSHPPLLLSFESSEKLHGRSFSSEREVS